MTDPEIEAIELGYCYVESKYHNLDNVRMIVSKIDLYLTDPGQNVFTLAGASIISICSGCLSAFSPQPAKEIQNIIMKMLRPLECTLQNV